MSIYDLNINDLNAAKKAAMLGMGNKGGSFASIDPAMTLEGSIFSKVGTTMEDGKVSKPDDKKDEKEIVKEGKIKASEALAQADAAGILGTGLKEQAEADKAFSEKSIDFVVPNVQSVTGAVTKETDKVKKINKENLNLVRETKAFEGQIEDLQNEIDNTAGDNTGKGKSSAFSLTLGGGTPVQEPAEPGTKVPPPNETGTPDEEPTEGDSEIEGKEDEIEDLQNKIGANNKKIKQNTTKVNSSKSFVDNLVNSAEAKYKAAGASATDASGRAENGIATGKMVAGIGSGVTTVGVLLTACWPTAALGAIVTAAGGVATFTGSTIITSSDNSLSASDKALNIANSASSLAQGVGVQFASHYAAKKA